MELPEQVRRRVVDVAADRLGALPPEEVPATLRPFARFAPARRRAVVLPIAAALETDEDFRAAVAEGLRTALPDLVAALEAGGAVPAADPVDVAAAAYLLRTPDWEHRVATVQEASRVEAANAAAAAELQEAQRRDKAAQAERAALEQRVQVAEARTRELQADLQRERRRAREATEQARRAEGALAAARAAAEAAEASRTAEVGAAHRALADLQSRLADTQAALDRARQDTRAARDAADTRRWLLLDTAARAVAGLREELGLAPPTRRPADLVDLPGPAAAPAPAPDDPASVDALLSLPHAHLVVDGYNVTKTGYPDLPLEDQRTRLVTGLAALAARTQAEVTCVFDGAEVQVRVPTAAVRRVRVLFSPAGEIADEVIRRLVRAEPPGRALVVASADREVVDGVRRAGARVVTPRALLARLERA